MTNKQSMLNKMQYIGLSADKPAAAPTTTPTNPTNPQDRQATGLGFSPMYKSPTQLAQENASAAAAAGMANNMFSDRDKQAIADNARTGATGIRDNYTAMDKHRAMPDYNANLGAGDIRGNINGLSNDNTRRMSRAVDAYNNATRWQPGLAGRRTNSSFGSNEMQANSFYKDTIDTQDARQMRTNERVAEQARMYDAARQDRVESHNIALQEKADELQMQMQQLIGQGDIDFGNETRRLIMDMQYAEPSRANIQMAVGHYLSSAALKDRTHIAELAATIWYSNPAFAQLYAQAALGVSMPSVYEYALAEQSVAMLNALVEQGTDPQAIIQALEPMMVTAGTAASINSVNAGVDVIQSSKIPNPILLIIQMFKQMQGL